MDDRVNGTAGQFHEEPPTPARRLNLTFRYLGLILPFILVFYGGFALGAQGSVIGGWICLALAVAVWLGVTTALLVRRDVKGAAAVSVVDILFYSPLLLLIAGVFQAD